MTKQEVRVKYLDKMAFKAEVNGHEIIIDAAEQVGGENRGPRPKPLMLTALAGCTGMDVSAILKKMRENIEELTVEVEVGGS